MVSAAPVCSQQMTHMSTAPVCSQVQQMTHMSSAPVCSQVQQMTHMSSAPVCSQVMSAAPMCSQQMTQVASVPMCSPRPMFSSGIVMGGYQQQQHQHTSNVGVIWQEPATQVVQTQFVRPTMQVMPLQRVATVTGYIAAPVVVPPPMPPPPPPPPPVVVAEAVVSAARATSTDAASAMSAAMGAANEQMERRFQKWPLMRHGSLAGEQEVYFGSAGRNSMVPLTSRMPAPPSSARVIAGPEQEYSYRVGGGPWSLGLEGEQGNEVTGDEYSYRRQSFEVYKPDGQYAYETYSVPRRVARLEKGRSNTGF